MRMSERDKVLMMIVPALVIALGYGVIFLRGKLVEHGRVTQGLADAQAKAPRPEMRVLKQAELAKLMKENQDLQARLEALEGHWRYATTFSAAGRNDRVEKLNALFKKNGLEFIEDAEADKDGKMSAAVERLSKRMTGDAKLHLRRIRFQGRYVDVHRVLDDLAHSDALGVPVGLTMKTTDDPARREWLLLIWI